MVNPYQDLEQILFRGFICQPILLGKRKTPILLKSLLESEFDQISLKFFHERDPERKFKYFVVYSLAQIDSINLLPLRNEVMKDLISLVTRWPEHYFVAVSQVMDKFRVRMEKAINVLDTYVYTHESRSRWFTYKGQQLNSPSITGWEGTENMPLSSIHRRWITLNALEDDKEDYEKHNDVARFMATAFNPKGMQKINDEEVRRRKDIEAQRAQAQERIASGRNTEGVTDFSKPEDLSSKELVGLLDHMLSGEQDDHDRMVAEYEEKLRRFYLEQKKKSLEALDLRTQEKIKLKDSTAETTRTLSREVSVADLAERSKRIRESRTARQKIQTQRSAVLSPSDKARTKLGGMVARLSEEEEALIKYDAYDPNQPIPDVIRMARKAPEEGEDSSETRKEVPDPSVDVDRPSMGAVDPATGRVGNVPDGAIPEYVRPPSLEDLRNQQGL